MKVSSGSKKSGQKHQNTFAFVPSKHSPKAVEIASKPTVGVCKRCYEIIEWKKKTSKYKPLTQPKTCANCKRKAVKEAYHVFCRDCASDKNVCPKCTDSNDLFIGEKEAKLNLQKEESENLKLHLQLQTKLNERQKRSFKRKLENGDHEGANRILEQALKNSNDFSDFSDDDFSDDLSDDICNES